LLVAVLRRREATEQSDNGESFFWNSTMRLLLCNDCSDLALILGNDGEAPAQIGQPAIIKGADLVGSNVEGGAPFNGEAFETRPLGGDHSLPLLIDGSLRTGTLFLTDRLTRRARPWGLCHPPQLVGDALIGIEDGGMDIDAAFSLGAGVLQVGTMDEDVGGSLVWLDEAVAFPVFEELHGTCDAYFTLDLSEAWPTEAHRPRVGRP
jgi:hypothetical protein